VQRLQRAVELRLPWHRIDLTHDRRSQLGEHVRSTGQWTAGLKENPPMKTLVSIITLGLAVAFAAPAFAADKAPTSKSACEKAHMTWDATAKKCK